jgi:hypothetical protein
MAQDPPLLPVSYEKLNDGWFTYGKDHNPITISASMTWYAGTPSG